MAINLNKVTLEKLKGYDFVIVGDGSGSTEIKDVSKGWFGKKSRWDAINESVSGFVNDLEEIDDDGLGLVIFSGRGIMVYDGVNAEKIKEVFEENSPGGSTPLAEAMAQGFKLFKNPAKRKFMLVFTDGVPNSRDAVEQLIIKQANSQATEDECTILFVQVGEDASATKFLAELDDGLINHTKFDIVDAKTAKEAAAFNTTLDLIIHAIED
jgi:hypothetical protein